MTIRLRVLISEKEIAYLPLELKRELFTDRQPARAHKHVLAMRGVEHIDGPNEELFLSTPSPRKAVDATGSRRITPHGSFSDGGQRKVKPTLANWRICGDNLCE
jgi:hypothetical protein